MNQQPRGSPSTEWHRSISHILYYIWRRGEAKLPLATAGCQYPWRRYWLWRLNTYQVRLNSSTYSIFIFIYLFNPRVLILPYQQAIPLTGKGISRRFTIQNKFPSYIVHLLNGNFQYQHFIVLNTAKYNFKISLSPSGIKIIKITTK